MGRENEESGGYGVILRPVDLLNDLKLDLVLPSSHFVNHKPSTPQPEGEERFRTILAAQEPRG